MSFLTIGFASLTRSTTDLSSSVYILILVALIAGAMMPTQAGVNHRLALALGNPILSAFVSFIVGSIALLLYIVLTGIPLSALGSIRNAPPISWFGGLLGAFFVASTIILLPRLGVAMTFTLVIAGQMVVTLIIDNYGLFGLPVKEINLPRVAGILLVVVGVVLIRRF